MYFCNLGGGCSDPGCGSGSCFNGEGLSHLRAELGSCPLKIQLLKEKKNLG